MLDDDISKHLSLLRFTAQLHIVRTNSDPVVAPIGSVWAAKAGTLSISHWQVSIPCIRGHALPPASAV
jgi:hypothetical protein